MFTVFIPFLADGADICGILPSSQKLNDNEQYEEGETETEEGDEEEGNDEGGEEELDEGESSSEGEDWSDGQ